MKINIIAACDKNNLIGVDGKLPWSIPEDLKRFKELTMGNAVIMGRCTFESLGSKPLPGRKNIIVSSRSILRAQPYEKHESVCQAGSVGSALKVARFGGSSEVFFIGGERIYKEALDYAERIYLTVVDREVISGDNKRYFPVIPDSWKLYDANHYEHSGGFAFLEYSK